MQKIGLIYGTEFGNTRLVGSKISAAIGNYRIPVKMLPADKIDAHTLESLDVIILGAAAYNDDEASDGWGDLEYCLSRTDLSNKTIAFYGLGDQRLYPDSFLDSMGWLYQCVSGRGARIVGGWPVIGYSFNKSKAVTNDGKKLFGLAIDQNNQSSLTDFRIANWVAYVMHEIEKFSTVEELPA